MAAEKKLSIEEGTIKNTVINNLVDRNRNRDRKDKEKSYLKLKEQWSIQLLSQLGLVPKVPDPDFEPDSEAEGVKKKGAGTLPMSESERIEMLKNLGI